METVDDRIIDAFGGTTAVARSTLSPPSTVHSWRKNGIPQSRRLLLDLLAEREGKRVDWEAGALVAGDGGSADHADGNSDEDAASSPDKAGDRIGGEATQVAA